MPEWTLCADLKVYAGLQSPAKPTTHQPAQQSKTPTPGTVDHEVIATVAGVSWQ